MVNSANVETQKKVEIGQEKGSKSGNIIHLWPRSGFLCGKNGPATAHICVNVVRLRGNQKRLVFLRPYWSKLPQERINRVLPEGMIIDLGKVPLQTAIKEGKNRLQRLCRS